jgi:hypothetical protein
MIVATDDRHIGSWSPAPYPQSPASRMAAAHDGRRRSFRREKLPGTVQPTSLINAGFDHEPGIERQLCRLQRSGIDLRQMTAKAIEALDVDGPAVTLQDVPNPRLADVLDRCWRAAWLSRFDL